MSTCVLLQIFPAPFTETRSPRFIFGPPYRSQRRPATCCSILSPACWALPFCQLARFRGLPFDHSSQHECATSTEAAFSIPLSSTPIFFLPLSSKRAFPALTISGVGSKHFLPFLPSLEIFNFYHDFSLIYAIYYLPVLTKKLSRYL